MMNYGTDRKVMNFLIMKNIIWSITFSISLVGCSGSNSSTDLEVTSKSTPVSLSISGKIDMALARKIVKRGGGYDTIIINSGGGEVPASVIVANEIMKNNIHVIVEGVCYSSCAEFILPAAETITFKNNPLVGYHHNPMIKRHLYKSHNPVGIEFCDFEDAEKMSNLLIQRGLSVRSWEATFTRLSFRRVSFNGDGVSCPELFRTYHYYLWLPTSEQLKTIFGLQFSGELCADEAECYMPKLDETSSKGSRYWINGQAYEVL